jgi:AraC-like DNA-binding protein
MMDMNWNQNKMMKLLEDFYTLSKYLTSFFDINGKIIITYPPQTQEYCNYIRSKKTGDSACRRCDEQAFQRVSKMKTPYIYKCHAGLTEIVVPIITSEKERIGYLTIGQAKPPGEPDENILKDLGKKHNLSVVKLKSTYSKIPVIKIDQARACANILHALAINVWYDNYFYFIKKPLSDKVKEFISDNLDKPLTLTEIANRFRIGKTTLCKSVKQDLQVTVNGLIHFLRIEKAKQLLRSAELPIYSIADQVGIPDYNYFTKIFKKETGITPSVFRKLSEKEYVNQHPLAP